MSLYENYWGNLVYRGNVIKEMNYYVLSSTFNLKKYKKSAQMKEGTFLKKFSYH